MKQAQPSKQEELHLLSYNMAVRHGHVVQSVKYVVHVRVSCGHSDLTS